MPTYVISKLKRSIASDKIGDLVDQEHPSASLDELAAADEIIVLDVTGNAKVFKKITRAKLLTQLNGVIAATWGKISGKPGTFPPETHTHDAAAVTSGVFDSARIPNVPQFLALPAPADRTITFDLAYSVKLAAATGGTGDITYSISGLPAGLTFVDTRVLSGTPTALGEHEVTLTATDAGNPAQSASRVFTIRVQPAGFRYIGISGDKTIRAAELTGGRKYAIGANNLRLQTWSGSVYIAIAQPASQPDLTRISLAGLGNSISDFDKLGSTTDIAGIDYEIWRGKELQGSAISGEVIEVRP